MRPARLDDLEAVFAVMKAQEISDYDESALSLDAMRAAWQAQLPRMWVVSAADGQIVACGEMTTYLSTTASALLVWVLPAYQGRGIGTTLLLLLESWEQEQRAAAGQQASQGFFTQVGGRNTNARRVLEKSGYTCSSIFQIMELAMSAPPQVPAVSDGLAVRLFVAGQDEQAVYEADEEAFMEKRGKTPRSFEVWSRRLGLGTPRFDPALWFVAWDGDTIAGTAMSEVIAGPRGEVMHVGVRRPWRHRGLGMALLLRTLGEFYQRGIHTVRLNVDAESLTNAQQLYARAGFQAINSYCNYEKIWDRHL
jgi:GNAT superfamily N-acetyltransferase